MARCPMVRSSWVCISTCWRCRRTEIDWRLEYEWELGYRCSVCEATDKVIAFCRLFPVVQSCGEEVGGHVLWFLRESPVRRQRRGTFRYFFMGAPWTKSLPWTTCRLFEQHFRKPLWWRGRLYRTHCDIDNDTDLYDLIIAFLL